MTVNFQREYEGCFHFLISMTKSLRVTESVGSEVKAHEDTERRGSKNLPKGSKRIIKVFKSHISSRKAPFYLYYLYVTYHRRKKDMCYKRYKRL